MYFFRAYSLVSIGFSPFLERISYMDALNMDPGGGGTLSYCVTGRSWIIAKSPIV